MSEAPPASRPAASHPAASHREPALFLDVDGTLLDLAPTPSSVSVPQRLPELLADLAEHLDGALALISGRDLHEIDRLFVPHRFCAAGAHGGEVRMPGAAAAKAMLDPGLVDAIHAGCRTLPSLCPGVLVEYKRFGAAIHHRLAPEAGPMVAAHALQLLQQIGPRFELQPGKCVYEIKPAGFSKGTAIRELMSAAPFVTRRPIFIGDDATDEHGFEAVNKLGGVSIKVGFDGPSSAMWRVGTAADVRQLLALLRELCTPRERAPDWLGSLFANRIVQRLLRANASEPASILDCATHG